MNKDYQHVSSSENFLPRPLNPDRCTFVNESTDVLLIRRLFQNQNH